MISPALHFKARHHAPQTGAAQRDQDQTPEHLQPDP